MPENEFEKQVQQKMNELQFAPSAAAWEKVEKQIAEKKKRRRVLLWLPLFFLLLGGTGWYYFIHQQTGINSVETTGQGLTAAGKQHESKPETITVHDDNKNRPTIAGHRLAIDTTKERNGLSAPLEKHNAGIPGLIVANKRNTIISKEKELNAKETTDAFTPLNKKTNFAKPAIPGYSGKHVPPIEENITNLATATRIASGSPEKNAETTVVALSTNDSIASSQSELLKEPVAKLQTHDQDSAKTKLPQDSTNTLAKNKPVTNKTTGHKIEWGISIAAGSSQRSAGFPGIHQVYADPLLYAATQSNGSNVNNSSISYSPSAVTSHFAWSAAILLRKSIGRTWKLNTGINYANYATGIALGPKINDTTGAGRTVYRNGRSASYTNHMQFLAIPFSVEKQLGWHSRFSVQTGFAFAVLAGTNQLSFDQQSNQYYADKNIVNKTQWSFLVGLQYRPVQKRIQWQIGPLFNYQLANTFNKDVYGNGHWFFAGLQSVIFFSKTKK